MNVVAFVDRSLHSSGLGSPTCMPILTVFCLTCIPSETGSSLLVGLTTRTKRFVVTDLAEIGACKVIVLALDTAGFVVNEAMLAIEQAGMTSGFYGLAFVWFANAYDVTSCIG